MVDKLAPKHKDWQTSCWDQAVYYYYPTYIKALLLIIYKHCITTGRYNTNGPYTSKILTMKAEKENSECILLLYEMEKHLSE